MKLVVDNDADQTVADAARALWLAGEDRSAIANALMDCNARLLGGALDPDAAIEVLALFADPAEARAAVLEALLVRARAGC